MFSQLCTRTKQAQWRDARPFPYNKGVKKGDVLSPELFNAGLEEAISSWKRRLATHGLGDQGTRKNVWQMFDMLMIFLCMQSLSQNWFTWLKVYAENLPWWGFNYINATKTIFFTLCTENLSMAARWVCFPMLLTSIWEEYMQVIWRNDGTLGLNSLGKISSL